MGAYDEDEYDAYRKARMKYIANRKAQIKKSYEDGSWESHELDYWNVWRELTRMEEFEMNREAAEKK